MTPEEVRKIQEERNLRRQSNIFDYINNAIRSINISLSCSNETDVYRIKFMIKKCDPQYTPQELDQIKRDICHHMSSFGWIANITRASLAWFTDPQEYMEFTIHLRAKE